MKRNTITKKNFESKQHQRQVLGDQNKARTKSSRCRFSCLPGLAALHVFMCFCFYIPYKFQN